MSIKKFVFIVIIVVLFCLIYIVFPLYLKKSDKENEKNNAKSVERIEVVQVYDLSKANFSKNVVRDVTVTSYNNKVAQTDSTPNVTSTNRPVREGMVAVSRDLITKGIVKHGDLVNISCFDKWYIVDDVMNKRYTNRVDVFLFDKKESMKINKKCDITVIHVTK